MPADPATPFRLVVPAASHADMVAHALAEMPNECCGLLAGVVRDGVGTVTHWLPLVNALQAPDEFESEPKSLLAAHRMMRGAGVDILAVYHSHPTSAPLPSRKDRDRNYSEDVQTIIIGLAGEVPDVRYWWLTATDYREAACTVA